MESFLNIIFVVLLVVVSVNDIQKMEIPNRLNLTIFLLGLARLIMLVVYYDWKVCGAVALDGIVGLCIVSIPLAVVAIVTKGAIGGGDIKLVGACGFYLGSCTVLHGVMLGFVFGGIYATVWLLMGKKNKRAQALNTCFALGPFLCAGMIIASCTLNCYSKILL